MHLKKLFSEITRAALWGIGLTLACGSTKLLAAENLSASDLIRKMDARKSGWVAMKAALRLDFVTALGKKASCEAALVYHRLDERMVLVGRNAEGGILFVFKTDDRHFELYLASKNTVFRGHIFDLENSPVIESHLKPLDLYRALKPMSLPDPPQSALKKVSDDGTAFLETQSTGSYPARKIRLTREGDCLEERYLDASQNTRLRIRRVKFQGFLKPDGGPRVFFPKEIRLDSAGTGMLGETAFKKTRLYFDKVEFLSGVPEEDLDWRPPAGTAVQSLSE